VNLILKGYKMLKKAMLVSLTAVLLLVVVESLTAQPPGRRGFGGRRGGGSSAIEQQPLGADEQEKKILSVLEDMDQNQSRGMMNVSQEDGRILRLLTESIGAKHVV
jgi:hypothetical protein